MTIDGAIIKEQGQTFAIGIVQRGVIDSSSRRQQAASEFAAFFEGLPTVLMEQDHRGVPRYWGRSDIVNFLAGVPLEAIPFQRWTVQ